MEKTKTPFIIILTTLMLAVIGYMFFSVFPFNLFSNNTSQTPSTIPSQTVPAVPSTAVPSTTIPTIESKTSIPAEYVTVFYHSNSYVPKEIEVLKGEELSFSELYRYTPYKGDVLVGFYDNPNFEGEEIRKIVCLKDMDIYPNIIEINEAFGEYLRIYPIEFGASKAYYDEEKQTAVFTYESDYINTEIYLSTNKGSYKAKAKEDSDNHKIGDIIQEGTFEIDMEEFLNEVINENNTIFNGEVKKYHHSSNEVSSEVITASIKYHLSLIATRIPKKQSIEQELDFYFL